MTDLSSYSSYGDLALYAYYLDNMLGFTDEQIAYQIGLLNDGDPTTNPIYTPEQIHAIQHTRDVLNALGIDTAGWSFEELLTATVLLQALLVLGVNVSDLNLHCVNSLSDLIDVFEHELSTGYSLDTSDWSDDEIIVVLLLLAEAKADGLVFTVADFINLTAKEIIEYIIDTAEYDAATLTAIIQSYLNSLGISY